MKKGKKRERMKVVYRLTSDIYGEGEKLDMRKGSICVMRGKSTIIRIGVRDVSGNVELWTIPRSMVIRPLAANHVLIREASESDEDS